MGAAAIAGVDDLWGKARTSPPDLASVGAWAESLEKLC
jgi:hypothetical protein